MIGSAWASAFASTFSRHAGHDLSQVARAALAKWLDALPATFDEAVLSVVYEELEKKRAVGKLPTRQDQFIEQLKNRITWRWKDHLRRQRSSRETSVDPSALSSLPAASAHEVDDYTEALLRLCRTLTLSETLVLRAYLDGKSIPEAAALQGIAMTTARWYLSSVRRKARRLFGRESERLKEQAPASKSDEVSLARSIAAKVKDLREIPCPYCRAKGQPGVDPGESILGGHTKAELCRSCDLHGVVWRYRNVMKTLTAGEVIARWGSTLNS